MSAKAGLAANSHGLPLRRRFIAGGGLALLLGVTGCFERITKVGPPERIGRFSIQKYHVVSFYDTGNREWDYFEMSHGRFLPTTIRIPPGDWSHFDRVTRLPSNSLAWMVEYGAESALVTEKDGEPWVEILWKGERDGPIRPITATRWHIPDYRRVTPDPFFLFSGGHIFDGATLTQRELPNQPDEGPLQFVALSPDDKAVAWFRREYDKTAETRGGSVLISDEFGMPCRPLALSEDYLKRNRPPDELLRERGPAWPAWLDRNFSWKLDASRRWTLDFKPQ
jgi:hypothetical protein